MMVVVPLASEDAVEPLIDSKRVAVELGGVLTFFIMPTVIEVAHDKEEGEGAKVEGRQDVWTIEENKKAYPKGVTNQKAERIAPFFFEGTGSLKVLSAIPL